jgi:hypothetical protein
MTFTWSDEKRKNKTELESILTAQLRAKEPLLSQVLITDDGEYAILQVANKQTRRKFSHYGKEFLRTGDVTLVEGESFLEPE